MHADSASAPTILIVTATRPRGATKVAVEVDGQPWRVLPVAALARAGVANGVVLDRERARALNRALRAEKALAAASRLLRHSDQTTHMLETKLEQRGVAAPERAAVVKTLRAARIVDDARFARSRAYALSGRLYGDDAIRHDLGERGLVGEVVEEAIAHLEPETVRVDRAIEGRGASRQTLAFLGRRGFSADGLETIVARVEAEGLG